MKNTLTINANDNFILECLDSVNDGTNGLYLHFITSVAFTISYAGHGVQTITPDNNTVEIDPSWYLSSDLIFTVGGVSYTVLHPTTTTGEMMVQAVNDTTYQVSFKAASGGGSYGLGLNGTVLELIENGGSPSVELPIDAELSDTSENAIQNKAVTLKMNEVFQLVSNGKSLVASAITDKGVPTGATDTFATMASNIRNIPSGGGVTWELMNAYYDFVTYEVIT